MKFALGTVQFGLDYGIANSTGRTRIEGAASILRQAHAQGIDTLDTAISYGESESTLGQIGVEHWHVVTKLPALPDDCADVRGWVDSHMEASLQRLGISQAHGVLLHRPDQLLGSRGEALFNALQHIKAQGITRKVGISVYGPDELEKIATEMPFDLVQAPLSILDRRLVESGWAQRLKDQGTELHVRSAFLQGLLLLSHDKRPAKFARWNTIWSEWARWLGETGLTPLQACLGYVVSMETVDKVVVGVDSPEQLQEVLTAYRSLLPSLPDWQQPIDMDLINPARWSQI